MEYYVIKSKNIGNLLTKELTDHRLDVLFSYPEPEDRQSTVLDVFVSCKENLVYFPRELQDTGNATCRDTAGTLYDHKRNGRDVLCVLQGPIRRNHRRISI